MTKIIIEGQRFDTAKAVRHIHIAHHDGHNMLYGEIYKSSGGQWYVYTPSQWSNGHRWALMSPEEIHESYGHMLDSEERAIIEADIQGWE